MTKIFNKKEQKEQRRALRNDMTKAEKLIWHALRNHQIEGQRFLRQFSIDNYIADFYCPRLKFVIKIDGDSHFQDNQCYDILREKYFESLGLKVLRFTNTEVYKSLNGVIDIIKEKINNLKN